MGVLRMGVLVTGCPEKNPYDSHSPKLVPKLITGSRLGFTPLCLYIIIFNIITRESVHNNHKMNNT